MSKKSKKLSNSGINLHRRWMMLSSTEIDTLNLIKLDGLLSTGFLATSLSLLWFIPISTRKRRSLMLLIKDWEKKSDKLGCKRTLIKNKFKSRLKTHWLIWGPKYTLSFAWFLKLSVICFKNTTMKKEYTIIIFWKSSSWILNNQENMNKRK